MGESFVAIGNDLNAVFWNPAGLAGTERPQAFLSHNQWLSGMKQEALLFSLPTESGAMGGGLLFLHMDRFKGYDSKGNPAGEFDSYDRAVILSYARRVSILRKNIGFSLGTNLRILSQKLHDKRSDGFSVDAGLMWEMGALGNLMKGVRIGFVIQNMGPELKFSRIADPLPFNIKAGLSYQRKSWLLSIEADNPVDRAPLLKLGGEWKLYEVIFLRAGTGSSRDSAINFSAGIGFRAGNWQIDYAYLPMTELSHSHRFTLSVNLGRRVQERVKLSREEWLTREMKRVQEKMRRDEEEVNRILRQRARAMLLDEISGTEGIEVGEKGDRVSITLTEKVGLFVPGSSVIRDESFPALDKVAELIKQNPDRRVEIEGHTDNIGPEEYNRKLSYARAQMVLNYFVARHNLPVDQFIVQGYGEDRPVASNETPSGRARNRRVCILIGME